MKGISAVCLLGFVLVLQGCDGRYRDYHIPAQAYGPAGQAASGKTGALLGRVTFPSDYAQRSITITLDKQAFTSHPDGRFRIEDVPTGSHQLSVRVKGYENLARVVEILPGEPTLVEELRLRNARGFVFGRLVDDDGQSAPDVALNLYPSGGVAVTDNDGIFQFIGVNSGIHTLRITDPRFFTYDRAVRVHSGERQNLGNIEVFPRVDSPVKRTARLNGE